MTSSEGTNLSNLLHSNPLQSDPAASRRNRRATVGKIVAMCALSILGSAALAGCGGGDSDESAGQPLSPEAQAGKEYVASNCLGCHTTNGAASSGPTFKGLAGSQVKLEDGSTVTADDAYLTQAILDPGASISDGYGRSMVSAVPPGSVSEEEAAQMVAYMNTLK